MNQVPVLSEAAPWPKREEIPTPFFRVGNALLNEPSGEEGGMLRYNEQLVDRQKERLEEAKRDLIQRNNEKADLENRLSLNAQLRQQLTDDITRIERVLAQQYAVKPKPRPEDILMGRDRLMKMIADFYYASTLGTGKEVLLNFPADLLRECLEDYTEINDQNTGENSHRITRGLLGVLFGKTVHDAAHTLLFKLNNTRVSVFRNERG